MGIWYNIYMAFKKNIDENKMIELYNMGLSDYAIADKIGACRETTRRRLRGLGLKSTHPKNAPMVELDGKMVCTKCSKYKEKTDFIYMDDGKLRFRFCKKCKNRQWTDKIHISYESYIKHTISQIKHRSKINGCDFDIDVGYLIELWDKQNGLCFYSDKVLNIHNIENHNSDSPSLDKITPEKGYVKGNVVWSVQRINAMKNDASLGEMKIWMPDWHARIIKYLEGVDNVEF